jgi:hypothetical protein
VKDYFASINDAVGPAWSDFSDAFGGALSGLSALASGVWHPVPSSYNTPVSTSGPSIVDDAITAAEITFGLPPQISASAQAAINQFVDQNSNTLQGVELPAPFIGITASAPLPSSIVGIQDTDGPYSMSYLAALLRGRRIAELDEAELNIIIMKWKAGPPSAADRAFNDTLVKGTNNLYHGAVQTVAPLADIAGATTETAMRLVGINDGYRTSAMRLTAMTSSACKAGRSSQQVGKVRETCPRPYSPLA